MALTQVLADKLDRSQRKMMRRVLGLKWSNKVTNEELYIRCGIAPASLQVANARWRLFGHTLRMDINTPARKAMAYYFVKDHEGRKGNRVTIATALSKDYEAVTGRTISNSAQYEAVVALAVNRITWKELVQKVTDKHFDAYNFKVQRREELRLTVKHICSA